jgi:hypothetical protein
LLFPSHDRSQSSRTRTNGNADPSINRKKRLASDPNERDRLERQQLDDYIRRRSEAVDRDIEELRQRLGSTASSLSGTRGAEGVVGSSSDRHTMRITGASVGPSRGYADRSGPVTTRGGPADAGSGGSGGISAHIKDPELRAFLSMLNDGAL